MGPKKHWAILIGIILALDVSAVHFSSVTGNIVSSEEHAFTVSGIYDNALLGDYVYVRGEVSNVLDDHISKKGYEYQQFMVTDGTEEIKLFCSTKYGRTDVEEGDVITFDGEFKKFYNTYEIYGFCSEIRKIF